MPQGPYTRIRAAAYTPFTGKGSGYDSFASNVIAFSTGFKIAMGKIKEFKDDEKVLPVFLAPECMFKKKNGVYGPEDVEEILEMVLQLSKSNPNVLIFAGTILWVWEAAANPPKLPPVYDKLSKPTGSRLPVPIIFNTVPVAFDGGFVHVYHTRFWGKDLKPDAATGKEENLALLLKEDDPYEFKEKFKGLSDEVDVDGAPASPAEIHIFGDNRLTREIIGKGGKTKAGIQFGIEIGNDKVPHKERPLTKSGRKVDVQVLLSGGYPLEAKLLCTAPEAVALGCDGDLKGGDSKKSGFTAFRVDLLDRSVKPAKAIPPVIPAPTEVGKSFPGADTVVLDALLSFQCTALPKGKDAPTGKERAKEWLAHRETVGALNQDELKKIFEKNVKLRAEWVKQVKGKHTKLVYEALMNEFWESDALKGKFFPESAMGVSLGFFLGVNRHIDTMYTSLGALNDELFLMGNYLVDHTGKEGLCWIQGPLKKKVGGFEKTVYRPDSDGNAVANKDFVRGTIVANAGELGKNKTLLEEAVKELRAVCKPKYGIEALEDKEATAKADNSGYTGFNFKLLLAGYPKPALPKEDDEGKTGWGWRDKDDLGATPVAVEIQLNTAEMMFGKHSMKLLTDMGVFTKDTYAAHEKKVGFQGGLGHTFYEVSRVDPKSATGAAATALSRDYYARCRMAPGENKPALEKLNKDLEAFGATLTGDFKKKWEHSFDAEWHVNSALSAGAHSRTED
ncbi:MAG: hypothetical protein ACAI25_21040, partial [Planctomycetota bacterium]